jgi:hypothetical protein
MCLEHVMSPPRQPRAGENGGGLAGLGYSRERIPLHRPTAPWY